MEIIAIYLYIITKLRMSVVYTIFLGNYYYKISVIRYFYIFNLTYLHTLYAQFKRIMLVAHVLPRLLAHDWPQLRLMVWSLFNHTLQLYNYHNLHITYTKLPDRALTHCPGFLTAARSRVLCIPQVADSSLNSATDGQLAR